MYKLFIGLMMAVMMVPSMASAAHVDSPSRDIIDSRLSIVSAFRAEFNVCKELEVKAFATCAKAAVKDMRADLRALRDVKEAPMPTNPTRRERPDRPQLR